MKVSVQLVQLVEQKPSQC